MMAVKSASYTCDWCETKAEYDGEEAHREAMEDGWITVDKYPETGLTFCSLDCAISYF